MKKLKLHQYNVISRFCEDLAKGLTLAIILGQAFVATEPFLNKAIMILVSVFIALLLLFLAVYFSKKNV